MKRLNVRLFVNLFLIVMLSAVSAMTAHALTISGNNVGIGTDTPDQPLDVVGNINADGSVTANSFSGSGADLTDINGSNITSGTVLESLIDPLICRDSEVTSAISTHASNSSAHHVRYTDGEAVTAIKAADGHGSGLDADLLDGKHASDFASISHTHNLRGSRLWLLTDWYQGLDISWYTAVNFAYLGSAEGTYVSCHWYNSNTASFVLESVQPSWVPAGGKGFCNTQGLGTFGYGWMVVESDEPVFAVAVKVRETFDFARESNVPMIPIDCSMPQDYEFVCSAIAQ